MSHLQESRYDIRQQLMEGLLCDAFNGPCLHLDCSQVDGIVGRLHDWTEDFDALLWVDGACNCRGCFLCCPHHLREAKDEA